MTPNLYQSIERIVLLSRKDFKTPEACTVKLMEEVGEFAETVNYHQGYLPHKTMKEPCIGEAADVIQNVIAVLARIYNKESGAEIASMLEQYLDSKTDKWESVLVEAKAEKSAQEIKNEMTLDGHIDKAFQGIMSSFGEIGGGDAIHAYLTELAHRAVDKSFGQEKTEEQERAELTAALGRIFNWKETQ